MNQLSLMIGNLVISVALLCAVIWVCVRFYWVGLSLKIGFILGWGLLTVVGPAYVAIAIHIPRGDYITAVVALFFGAILAIPWVFIGLPELVKLFKKAK